MTARPFLLALACALGAAALSARDVLPLNDGWRFRYGWNFAGPRWESVTLPHTWNTADAEPDHPYTRTLGIYKRSLKTRPEWAGKRVFLRFKGAATVADVQFNNVWLGQHRGGYTAFCYELTPHLPPAGKAAELRVRLGNGLVRTADVHIGVKSILIDEGPHQPGLRRGTGAGGQGQGQRQGQSQGKDPFHPHASTKTVMREKLSLPGGVRRMCRRSIPSAHSSGVRALQRSAWISSL